jgi:hypothetical protein
MTRFATWCLWSLLALFLVSHPAAEAGCPSSPGSTVLVAPSFVAVNPFVSATTVQTSTGAVTFFTATNATLLPTPFVAVNVFGRRELVREREVIRERRGR